MSTHGEDVPHKEASPPSEPRQATAGEPLAITMGLQGALELGEITPNKEIQFDSSTPPGQSVASLFLEGESNTPQKEIELFRSLESMEMGTLENTPPESNSLEKALEQVPQWTAPSEANTIGSAVISDEQVSILPYFGA